MTKNLGAIPGSDAFQKLMSAIMNFTRGSSTTITTTDGLTVGELSFVDTTRKAIKTKKVALVAADTAGGIASFTPGVACVVMRIFLDLTTKATAACTLSAGVATNATTLSANLIDTLDINTATGLFDNGTNGGTNGKKLQRCSATQAITLSTQTGAAAGIVGAAYIEYFEL